MIKRKVLELESTTWIKINRLFYIPELHNYLDLRDDFMQQVKYIGYQLFERFKEHIETPYVLYKHYSTLDEIGAYIAPKTLIDNYSSYKRGDIEKFYYINAKGYFALNKYAYRHDEPMKSGTKTIYGFAIKTDDPGYSFMVNTLEAEDKEKDKEEALMEERKKILNQTQSKPNLNATNLANSNKIREDFWMYVYSAPLIPNDKFTKIEIENVEEWQPSLEIEAKREGDDIYQQYKNVRTREVKLERIGTYVPSIYFNKEIMASFIPTECNCRPLVSYDYIVPQGAYFSTISQADADAKARKDIATNGQRYANSRYRLDDKSNREEKVLQSLKYDYQKNAFCNLLSQAIEDNDLDYYENILSRYEVRQGLKEQNKTNIESPIVEIENTVQIENEIDQEIKIGIEAVIFPAIVKKEDIKIDLKKIDL